MVKNILIFVTQLLLIGAITPSLAQQDNPKVLLSTSAGDIIVELYPDQAPITTENFLKYVDQDLSPSASFYRVVTMENQPNNDI
ncbi:unnamed protein product, partial [marine sediment metagenome]